VENPVRFIHIFATGTYHLSNFVGYMISNRGGYFLRSRGFHTDSDHLSACSVVTSSMSHHLKPEPFSGLPSQDAGDWWTKFSAWLALNEWSTSPAKVANGLRLLLLPPASSWFDQLGTKITTNVTQLETAFRERFINNQPSWLLEQQLWSRAMLPTEGLDSYLTAVDTLCTRLGKTEADKITCFVRGLLPSLRSYVIQQSPKSFSAAVQAARLAHESVSLGTSTIHAMTTSTDSSLEAQIQELQEQVKALRTASPPDERPDVTVAAARNIICQLCHRQGHAADECHVLRSARKRPPPTCFFCQKRGHVVRDCREKQRVQRRGQEQTNASSLNRSAPSM